MMLLPTSTTHEHQLLIPVPEGEPRVAIALQNLRIPGPTPVPTEVLAELARPMIDHRGPEFAAMLRRVTARMQYVFQTSSPVLTFPASGTGGQECAIVNLFSPGEHVVAISIGHFGNRFAHIAEHYGLQVSRITFPWGEVADPSIVEARLSELAPYRGVLLTHNETSTGVTNDIQTLSAVIRQHHPDALIVVDAVSSLGCIPLEMDPWDLDVVFTASQKGLMCPPGLMMLAAGTRALAVAVEVGGVALAIDAKDTRAASWYKRFGAIHLLDDPLKLILPLALIAKAITAAQIKIR